MTDRLEAVLVAAACLVCGAPLILGTIGATTVASGATAAWFRRYDLAILAATGLTAVVWQAAHHRRPKPHHPIVGDDR